jgi:hypothetical protein
MDMQYKLVIKSNAQDDILEASDWYEEQKTGLGELFMVSVDDCIKLLIKNPFAFAKIYYTIRKANTKNYPYSLYYNINEKIHEVTIIAVISQYRSDRIWKQRLKIK